MIENHYKQVLETALLCSPEPLSINELSRLYGDEVTPENIITWLHELQGDWSEKGMELVHIATGWRFQSRLSMREYLDRMTVEKPPKYSRAVMETLAIIAYRQPVTRGEIEEIRGVTVSSQIVRQLEDRQWIEVIGHKDTIGRPALYATTKQFLDDMSIPNLQSLPSLEDGVVVDQIAQQVINFEQTLLDESAMEEEAQNLSTEHDSTEHESTEHESSEEEIQHPDLEEKKPNND